MHSAHLYYRYGIRIEEKERLFREQQGLCKLCAFPLPESIYKCHTDHNHDTGTIRGLVHRACNYLIGLVERNPECFAQLKRYLKE
jgi:hypothetical protein